MKNFGLTICSRSWCRCWSVSRDADDGAVAAGRSSAKKRSTGFTRLPCDGQFHTGCPAVDGAPGHVAGFAVLVLLSVPPFSIITRTIPQTTSRSSKSTSKLEGTSLESTEVLTTGLLTSAAGAEVDTRSYRRQRSSANPESGEHLCPTDADRGSQTRSVVVMGLSATDPGARPRPAHQVQQVATIGGGAQAADVQFVINGPDLAKLESISGQLMMRAKALPGVVDLDTSLNVGKPDFRG